MAIKEPTYQLKFDLDLPDEQVASALSAEDIRIRSEAARAQLEEGGLWKDGKSPVWFESYLKTVNGGWPWRVALLVVWLAMPKPRVPATQEELARQYMGLSSDRQFSVWIAKNPAIPAMVQDLRYGMLFEDLGEIFQAGIAVAKKQDYKSRGDRELIYKLVGILNDSVEVKTPDGNDLSKLSWEEKLRLAGIENPEALVALRNKLLEQALIDEERDEPTIGDSDQS